MSEVNDLGYDAVQEASQEAWKERTRGTGMTTKPMWTADGDPEPIDVEQAGLRPATALEVVAALIAEGGEIQEPMWDEFSQVSLPFSGSVNGRYLVFRIPAEEETTT